MTQSELGFGLVFYQLSLTNFKVGFVCAKTFSLNSNNSSNEMSRGSGIGRLISSSDIVCATPKTVASKPR